MRISDWSSDVCSSDLRAAEPAATTTPAAAVLRHRDRKLAARKEARRLARQRDKVRLRQRVDHALAFQRIEEAGDVQLADIEAAAQDSECIEDFPKRDDRVAALVCEKDRKSTRLNSSH